MPGASGIETDQPLIARLEMLLDALRADLKADTAAVLLYDQSRQFLVATAARGIEEEVRQGVRIRPGLGFAGRIAAERRPVVLDQISPANVVNPLLLRRGITSMLGAPILHEHRVLGVVHVGSLTPRIFTVDDISAVEEHAKRFADALARHQSFVDRTAAAALQRSLTPRLPDVPGIQLAARYVPGSQYGVGGDWYDVFPLPGTTRIGITIGDVMGHGLHAATVMGRARSALRAYAIEDDDPASALSRLDRKMQHFEPGLIGTVGYAILDPVTGELTVSSAGHLPPLYAPIDGPAAAVDVPVDPPIGVAPNLKRRSARLVLPERVLLCFYTDGLVERRTGDLDDEIDRLRRTLASPFCTSAESACVEIMRSMLSDREPQDDVSVLVLSRG